MQDHDSVESDPPVLSHLSKLASGPSARCMLMYLGLPGCSLFGTIGPDITSDP
jgi:hypothetical protein